jgi:hypothetical protein
VEFLAGCGGRSGPAARVSLPEARRHERHKRAGRVTAVHPAAGFLGTHGIRGALGVFGAFAGLVFIGVIKAGGKWYADSHPGWSAPRLRRTGGAVQAWKLANDPRAVAGPVWRAVGVQRSGSCVTLGVGDPPLMATPNRQICAQAMAHSTALTAIHIRRANSAPARPTESITLRDSRHGIGIRGTVGHSLTVSRLHTFYVFVTPSAARFPLHSRPARRGVTDEETSTIPDRTPGIRP